MILKPRLVQKSYPSVNYDACPAKTFTNFHGAKTIGRSVAEHCLIVGLIAEELIKLFSRSGCSSVLSSDAKLIAASHDVGKISPYFYEKILQNCELLPAEVVRLDISDPSYEKIWGGHAGCSQVALQGMNVPKRIPEIVGQHHGSSPPVGGRSANDEVFGGKEWQEEREKLVCRLKKELQSDWPIVNSDSIARAIAGLTTVSDWIGSGEFFEDPELQIEPRIKAAIDSAGFKDIVYNNNLSFIDIFGFRENEVQAIFSNQVVGPGIYILEAPMGVGKTEAALFAAYKCLAGNNANGIYFALPTQITSNKIFDRFNLFLAKILHDHSSQKGMLIHSNAWLQETEMGEDGAPGGSWFSSAKRAILAPFAVGTIDQALMACMNVRHGFVRTFGLMNKVVILDEVHTYDTYTSAILNRLIDVLQELNCTILVLSATLDRGRKKAIVKSPVLSSDYPLITSLSSENMELYESAVPCFDTKVISINKSSDVNEAINIALSKSADGQQVLWIENSVDESQKVYLELAARAHELEVECGLLHSRFTYSDRSSIEEKWVNLYGKSGWVDRRNRGRILVGTQILEQSLDLDADFLVTRFAPSSMILQRLGRLWRHSETPRELTATPSALIVSPNYDEALNNPVKSFGSSAFIYEPYLLCRSLEVWQNVTLVKLPSDIRAIVDKSYDTREETGLLQKMKHELLEGSLYKTGKNAQEQLARLTFSKSVNTMPECKAKTRYSEIDTIEVLILRHLYPDPDKKSTIAKLINGESVSIPWNKKSLSKKEWKQLASRLMKEIVTVNTRYAPEELNYEILKKTKLSNCIYIGNPDFSEETLRIAILKDDNKINNYLGGVANSRYEIEYRNDLGYRLIEKI